MKINYFEISEKVKTLKIQTIFFFGFCHIYRTLEKRTELIRFFDPLQVVIIKNFY